MKKVASIIIVFGMFILTFFIGWQFNKNYGEVIIEKDSRHLFNMDYHNKEDKDIKIRYKYILDYETSNDKVLTNLDYEVPLFTLSRNDEIVADIMPFVKKTPFIPTYSKAFSLKRGHITEDVFRLDISPDVNEVQDLIRFQVKVVVERLDNKMWTPVYQGVLMERGPYWSLDKGPFERLDEH